MRLRNVLLVMTALFVLPGCTTERSAQQLPVQQTVRPPAVGQPVVLDESVPGWETSGWLADEAFCVRAARTGERTEHAANEFVFCDPAPPALETVGPPLLPTKPMPYIAPLDPSQEKVILIGTARGEIADVSVTMFDQTATATVHRLPTVGAPQVGAYAVWLPRSEPGGTGMNLDDITAVVARDAAGDVIARLDD